MDRFDLLTLLFAIPFLGLILAMIYFQGRQGSRAHRPTQKDSRTKDTIWAIVAGALLFWACTMKHEDGLMVAFFILALLLPELLSGRFRPASADRSKSGANVLYTASQDRDQAIFLWSLIVFMIAFITVAYFNTGHFADLLGSWPVLFFNAAAQTLFFTVGLVFYPVFRTAENMERRRWLQVTWALLASLVAVAIVHFQHLSF